MKYTAGRRVRGIRLIDLRFRQRSEQDRLEHHLAEVFDFIQSQSQAAAVLMAANLSFIAAVDIQRPSIVIGFRAYFSPFSGSDRHHVRLLAITLTYTAVLIELARPHLTRQVTKQMRSEALRQARDFFEPSDDVAWPMNLDGEHWESLT